MELGNESAKEEDRIALMEGGLARSTSMGFQSSSFRESLMKYAVYTVLVSAIHPHPRLIVFQCLDFLGF